MSMSLGKGGTEGLESWLGWFWEEGRGIPWICASRRGCWMTFPDAHHQRGCLWRPSLRKWQDVSLWLSSVSSPHPSTDLWYSGTPAHSAKDARIGAERWLCSTTLHFTGEEPELLLTKGSMKLLTGTSDLCCSYVLGTIL